MSLVTGSLVVKSGDSGDSGDYRVKSKSQFDSHSYYMNLVEALSEEMSTKFLKHRVRKTSQK